MSVTRITGMATGMDTESIVKKLMDVERIPLNRLKQKQQTQMWMIDSYRQWNSDLFAFRNTNLFNMKLSGTYNTFDVGSSLSNSVTGTATSSAISGNYSISIKQLAESAVFTSSKVKLDTTKALGDVAQGTRQLTADTSISINVFNDPTNPTISQTATIAVNTTDKISDVVSKINSATDASGKSLGLQAIYDSNLQQFIVKTKATGETTKIDFSGTSAAGQTFLSNTLGIGINATVTGGAGPSFNITTARRALTIDLGGGISSTINLTTGTYTTKQLADEINLQIEKNSTLATNVKASVDGSGKITLASVTTGQQSSIRVTGTAGSFIGFPNTTTAGTAGTLVATGKNADVTFNGQQINTFNSNNITLMGINFTLKSPTVDANGNPITSNITVSRNPETALNNIKDFVTKYNELIDKLNKITTEAVYRDYQPLLDEQKGEMSEKQIEQWDAKAKSGLLRGDDIMTGLLYKMRNIMSSTVNTGSSYNSLSSIGISSRSYHDKGKLYIDEAKLKKALESDPDAVQKLFSQIEDTATGKTNGLANSLSDVVQDSIKRLTTKAGAMGNSQYDQSIIGRMLSRLQTDINRQNDRLTKKENLYYKQFAAMEEAVAKFNSQSSWLYSQSGGQ